MESIGSSFFLLILIFGIIFIIKKSKITGFLFIGISLFFLFVLPAVSFNNYKRNSNGVYIGSNDKKIVIKDSKYKIIALDKIVSTGNVEYSNIDNYSFSLGGDSNYESNIANQIRNKRNETEVFYK